MIPNEQEFDLIILIVFWNHVKANDSKWSKADYMVCQNKNLSNRSI